MPVKSYQSEAELEIQLIKQLNDQDYASVELNDYAAAIERRKNASNTNDDFY